MANKTKQLTCTFFVGGTPVKKITSEQAEKMARRFGETVSTYYRVHPEEFQKIKAKPLKESE